MARRPPRAEGVVEQELHHVVFGEELGHGADGGGADLVPALVDSFLLL